MRWVRRVRRLLPAIITAGLVMMFAGSGGAIPVSDPPDNPSPIEYLDRTESKYAELHQQLRQYIVCEETGRWDEWPCTQWPSPSPSPQG